MTDQPIAFHIRRTSDDYSDIVTWHYFSRSECEAELFYQNRHNGHYEFELVSDAEYQRLVDEQAARRMAQAA